MQLQDSAGKLILGCINNGAVANSKNSVAKSGIFITFFDHYLRVSGTMSWCQLDGYDKNYYYYTLLYIN